MTHLAWWYYISKFVEFADTIFFVLRKKFSHISTLHVIHHGMMPMSVWWGVKFTPGGHSTFFAFVNSLVHILMYFYYGLSAIGPHMNKYLWWKQYMTSFQMVQFIAIFIHSFQLLFRPDCNYPRGFMWWIGVHAIMFWFLFADFYKNAYLKKRLARKSLTKTSPTVSMRKRENTKYHLNGTSVCTDDASAAYNGSGLLNGYCYLGNFQESENEIPEAERQYLMGNMENVGGDQPRKMEYEFKEQNGKLIMMINRHKHCLGQNEQTNDGRRTRSSLKKAK